MWYVHLIQQSQGDKNSLLHNTSQEFAQVKDKTEIAKIDTKSDQNNANYIASLDAAGSASCIAGCIDPRGMTRDR